MALAAKVVIGTAAGYLIDTWIPERHSYEEDMERICADCGCHGHTHEHGKGHVFQAALHHTVSVFAYIFVFTGILNLAIELVGIEKLSAVLMGDSLLQPLLAALVGMIPNCASSVMLTQLYLSGAISFASAVAGLCTGAGLGLAVLFRMNEDKKESLKITGLLYAAGAVSGVVLSFFG